MITKTDIIYILKLKNIINKNRYRNRYVFPRIHDSSFLYMKSMKNRPIASIAKSIIEIEKLNISFKKNYSTNINLIGYKKFGLTYEVVINEELLLLTD